MDSQTAPKTYEFNNPESAEAFLKKGVSRHMSGDLDGASDIYREILKLNPRNLQTLHNYALLLLQTGNITEAINRFNEVLAIHPEFSDAHCNLGSALACEGRHVEAIASFKQALKLRTEYPAAWFNLANAFREIGNLKDAERAYNQFLKLNPDHAEAHFNLAIVLSDQGRYQEAYSSCKKSIDLNPDHAEGHYNIARLLTRIDRFEEAVRAYTRAVEIKPDYADAHFNLGKILHDRGRYDEAIVAYRKTIQTQPAYMKAYINLGIALSHQSRDEEAITCYRQAIDLDLQDYRLYYNLGNALKMGGDSEKAVEAYGRSIKLKPDFYDAYNNLAETFEQEGNIAQALKVQRDALANCPKSNLLNCGSFRMFSFYGQWEDASPLVDEVIKAQYDESELRLFHKMLFLMNATFLAPQEIFSSHTDWGKLQMAHCEKQGLHFQFEQRRKLKKTCLRIGYLSPDFRRHSVGFFFKDMAKNHDRESFEVHCYSLSAQEDDITAQIESAASAYKRVGQLNATDIARQVFEDEIDILVDLCGHTKANKLEVLGYKPAPIQVTAIGYPNTTGLSMVDYRITDRFADAPSSDRFYLEKLVRLPKCFLPLNCLEDPLNRITKGDLGLPRDAVTFSSFHALHKLNPRVLRLWNSILTHLPNAHLLFSFENAHIEIIQDSIRGYFTKGQDNRDRIVFLPRVETSELHRARYEAVDVALDTFPYSGTTTSYEALLMGVPIITLVGERHVQRTTYSLLKNVGLEEGISYDEADYLKIAVAMATNPERLSEARKTIQSGLTDRQISPGPYTKELEKAYTMMWERYQKGLHPAPFHVPSAAEEQQNLGRENIVDRDSVSDVPVPISRVGPIGRLSCKKLNLHIGGKAFHPDWKILDIFPGEHVDVVGDAVDLPYFKGESIDSIYASHILEHIPIPKLESCLTEWRRVLKPKGQLMLGVPDFEALSRLFLTGECDLEEKYLIMKMIMGSQNHEYDFHHVAFDLELLKYYLAAAGFSAIGRVDSFGIFHDSTELKVRGERISLNVIVKK